MNQKDNKKLKSRGRRPNTNVNTKEDILEASLKVFAKYGLENSSIRKIATEARVDSALLYHYFDTKEELFFEAIKSKMNPPERSRIDNNETSQERAKRIIRMFLERFNDSENSSTFLALMRSALQNQNAADLLKNIFEEQLVSHVTKQFDSESARLRVSISVSILLGFNFVRSILKLEPINSMTNDQISNLLTPLLTPLLSKEFKLNE